MKASTEILKVDCKYDSIYRNFNNDDFTYFHSFYYSITRLSTTTFRFMLKKVYKDNEQDKGTS